MKAKKLSVLAISGAIGVFALASCGGENNTNVITFYSSAGDSLAPLFDGQIEKFKEQNPGWDVKVTNPGGGYDGVKKAIIADLQAGKQPSLAYAYADHVAEYLPTGQVVDMNKFINDPNVGFSQEEIDDFVKGYYDEGSTAFGEPDKMYTLPFSKSTDAMYYNADVLKKLNIEVPKTWEELWKACETIKNHPDYKNWYPMAMDTEANWFITLAEQYGYDYTSAKGDNHYLFNNSNNIAMLKELKGYYDKGYFTTKTIHGGYTSTLFTAKREGKQDKDIVSCVFSIGSTGGANHQSSEEFTVGVAPYPQKDVNDRKSISQGPSLVMFNTPGNEEKVAKTWEFVKLLLEPTFQASFSMASGYMPVRKSSLEIDEYKTWLESDNIIAKTSKMASQYIDSYYVSPAFNGSNKARDEVGNALVAAVTGKKSVEDALKDAYDECNF